MLRCHVAAFDAIGGVPREILYDLNEDCRHRRRGTGGIVYNRALLDLARHYGFQPKACKAYRAAIPQNKGRLLPGTLVSQPRT